MVNESKEELMNRRKMLNEALDKADKSGDLFTCIKIGEALNVIDERLREMGVDGYHIRKE